MRKRERTKLKRVTKTSLVDKEIHKRRALETEAEASSSVPTSSEMSTNDGV